MFVEKIALVNRYGILALRQDKNYRVIACDIEIFKPLMEKNNLR